MGTFFCVVGDVEENPFILEAALDALYQATSLLLHGQVDKRTLLENLDYVMLVIDEVVDDGCARFLPPPFLLSPYLSAPV